MTTKRIDHSGIKVQLLGQIELASERGQPHEFVSLGEERARQDAYALDEVWEIHSCVPLCQFESLHLRVTFRLSRRSPLR